MCDFIVHFCTLVGIALSSDIDKISKQRQLNEKKLYKISVFTRWHLILKLSFKQRLMNEFKIFQFGLNGIK